MIDLNEFKKINDVFGHHTGDRVLSFVASLLKHHLPSDMVVRYAGDEFVVVFTDTAPANAAGVLTEIFPAIGRSARQTGLPDLSFTAGVSADRVEPLEQKLRDADRAMFEGKEGGTNAVKLA